MSAFLLVGDEGPRVGLGHRRRMEALFAELTSRGHDCSVVPLDAIGRAGACDAVVVDSYRVRADDPHLAPAPITAAVDDLSRDLAVDLVVDPSPGTVGAAHRRARRVLAGAAYALVPAAPAGVIEAPLDEVARVLVATGAADAAGVGARIAASLAAGLTGSAAGRPAVQIRLVIGPWGATDVPPGVVPVHAPGGLAAEIAAASLVVTAGGVTLLEACALGRPIVALALAENQRQAVCGLEREHAVCTATPEHAAEAVRALTLDRRRRIALAGAARSAVDGKGPTRVADTLEQLVAR